MSKRHLILLLAIFLIFILIPTSFSMGNESLTNHNDAISEIQSIDNFDAMDSEGDLDEIHVDVDGDDNNSGTYESPLSSIKKAINISSNNSKIIIHEGTYKENNLNITKSLEIVGEGNVVIDAENSSRIFTINTGTSDTVLLSGITFANGRAYQGGAIFVRNAVTTIDNSKFINNTALTEGGAIYWNSDYGRLTNTIIEGNYARDGSGVSWGGVNSTFTGGDYGEIINCTFTNNHLIQDEDACVGLSIYSNRAKVINSTFKNHNILFNSSFEVLYINGDYATVTGCIFANNSMTVTGALGFDGNYAVAYNNVFVNNTVYFNESFGGAIGIQSETANIYNNTFISNGGENCQVGGAIFINTIETFSFNFINITDNVFIGNKAQNGGAIYAIGKTNMLTLLIKNNKFTSDKAINGAGVYLADIYNPVTIRDNNFTDLIAENGAGIYSTGCILALSNNLMENSTSDDGGEVYTDGEVNSNLNLKFDDIVGVIGQPTTLTAVLTDDMGNKILTKYINFAVNGEAVRGLKGLNSITATFDGFGNYTIAGSYDKGTANIESGVLKVLHGAIFKTNTTFYGANPVIRFNLTDENGNNLSYFRVVFSIGDNNVLVSTDSDAVGQFKSSFNLGSYNITVRIYNNNNYRLINDSFKINVLSSISSTNMVKAYNSGIDFMAVLFKSDGSPLSNSEVTLVFNGKNYKVSTDLNGLAKFNAKLAVGSYNVAVNNPATGEVITNTLKIVKRITGNSNVNMYYLSGKSFKIRLYDDNGNAAVAGQIAKITVNGKSYSVKTDKNGYAAFKINLSPKTYTITATYKGYKVSNKIVVKPVLTAKNISKKKAKVIKFTAKLVNTNGKAAIGKKITFKFKGKSYFAKTNSKGIATLSLKSLNVGNYKIITKFGKSSITNTIKIKK